MLLKVYFVKTCNWAAWPSLPPCFLCTMPSHPNGAVRFLGGKISQNVFRFICCFGLYLSLLLLVSTAHLDF